MTFFLFFQYCTAGLPVDMWARVTAGQCELGVYWRANTTRENVVAMTRDRERERGASQRWRKMSNNREAEARAEAKKRVYPLAERGERRNNR